MDSFARLLSESRESRLWVGGEALHSLRSEISPATAVHRMIPTSHGCSFIMIKLKFSVISVLCYAQNAAF